MPATVGADGAGCRRPPQDPCGDQAGEAAALVLEPPELLDDEDDDEEVEDEVDELEDESADPEVDVDAAGEVAVVLERLSVL
ncbi:hypothetical protein M0M43_10615 [Pimelobacter simplex]|nr:hypothetical protein M0M43_10615 [Pimelobacter simplex]UUW98894.1 hypothetical protein M0M48_29115 [Pimelobacter simplex]